MNDNNRRGREQTICLEVFFNFVQGYQFMSCWEHHRFTTAHVKPS